MNAFIWISLILASILGVFGQSIAYFLNDNFLKSYPIYYLTVLTITSIFLYVSSVLLIYIQYRQGKFVRNTLNISLSLMVIVCLPIIFWSLFVLAMWWG